MVEIPNALAQSIRRGDCVLWTGAGLGGLADRPSWKQLLASVAESLDGEDRKAVQALIEKGRLRPVLDHLRRTQADALSRKLADTGKDAKLADVAAKLAKLPWASVFATVHADLAHKAVSNGDSTLELVAPDQLDGRALGNGSGRFVLHTPAELQSWTAHPDLHDVMQGAARSHTILLLGFSADDPDLEMVLDTVGRLGSRARHYALVSGLTAPERLAVTERFGVEVLDSGEALPEAIDALADAGRGEVAKPGPGTQAGFDLALAVGELPLRVDVASAAAMAIDGAAVARYVEAIGDDRAQLGAETLLRAAAVLLTRGDHKQARAYVDAAADVAHTDSDKALARLGRAWVDLAGGDAGAAAKGLREAAAMHPAAATAPVGVAIEAVIARHGARTRLLANHEGDKVEFEVTTLSRALTSTERESFARAIDSLAALEAGAVGGTRGGSAAGRRIVVHSAPVEGKTLAQTIASGPLSLAEAGVVIERLAQGLSAVHAKGLVHGALTTDDVVMASSGAMLRGFGPVAALGRAAAGPNPAPEVAAGGNPSAKSDAFDLGAVIFTALTGARATGGIAASALVPSLDPRVDTAIAAAMHPDPNTRASVSALRDAFKSILATPDARPSAAAAARPLVAPEDPNDLEGWTWLLEKKPTHIEARAAIERIEKESRDAGQWDRVAEVLSVRASMTQAVTERITLLRELAGLFENELGVPAHAFETTRKLLDAVPVSRQLALLDDLERLAGITGGWGPLADCVALVAERIPDPAGQAATYARLGTLFIDRLGATDRAIGAFEQAVALAPSADNLGVLVPLYRKAMRIAELATTLLSLAEHQQGRDKAASLMAAAEVLHSDLGETEGAFASLSAVLEIEPDNGEALAQSEELARELESWESLVDILARRAGVTLDPAIAVESLREAAQLCLEPLKKPEAAVGHLAKLLEHDRSDRAAADQLVALLRDPDRLDPSRRAQLIDALAILVDLVDTPDAVATVLIEQAALLDQEVDGKERAADARERVLQTLGFGRAEAQAAAAALEKWYRRKDGEPSLVRLLERMGGATDAGEAYRVEAWSKLLQLRNAATPDDPEGAIAALEKLTDLEPDNTKWRDELLVRYLDKEDFKKAGPLIRAQVSDETDPKRKAELLLRGGLLREQIGKIDGAIEALEHAVELDGSRHEAWLALRDLYVNNEQPLKAIEAQVSGARVHPSRAERARMTFEAASRYLDDLGQPVRGMELLAELVELDPDHREATGMLVERLVGIGDLKAAWTHSQTYVMQVRSQAANDKALNVRALSIAGRCALAVGESDRARDYLEKARTFDATNLDVLRLLADLSMEAGAFADALRHYQSVVLGVGSKMAPPDLSRLYVHMADARKGMDEPAKAVQMAERALELDPDNEAAIDKLIELAPLSGGATAVVKAKQRLSELLKRRYDAMEAGDKREGVLEDRVEVLQSLAKLQAGELKAPLDAVYTLEQLLEIKPGDPGVLHEMLGMFTKGERWRDAANVIHRLADAQSEASNKAKYLWAGTLIFRDHLDDVNSTLDGIKRVLELDPMHVKAYDAGVELLTAAGKFKELARQMRGRLKALPKDAPADVRVALFAGLGDIYERHLDDPKTAIAAYNQSVRFATGELAGTEEVRLRRMKVMRLAVQLGDDEIDKAIMQGHALIGDNPMDFEVYHRLVELYLRNGDRDRARALSRTLAFLKQADEAEQELADQTGGAGSTARRKIPSELWRKAVRHRSQNARISEILATVWPMVAAREGHTHKQFELARSDRTDVSIQSPSALARFLSHACQVIDSPAPDYFERKSESFGLTVDALVDTEGEQQRVYTSVIAGKQALGEKSEAGLRFHAGRAIARTRPEHILGAMLPDARSLRNALLGAIALALPDAEIPLDSRTEAERLAELYRTYLPPSKIELLAPVASRLVASGDLDTQLWLESAAYTVTRAGFVLCDDLQTAARILTNEGDAGRAVPVKERVRDLVAYSVSDPYLKLRREIGLAG